MTQNNIIEQIVEVLHKHSKFAAEKNGKAQLYVDDVKAAATEIASLHPLTKIREEVERLRDEAVKEYNKLGIESDVIADEDDEARVSELFGTTLAFEEVLSLLPQENDGWISVGDAKLENDAMYYICWAGRVFDPLEWEEDSQSFTDGRLYFHKSEITHVMPYILPSPPKSK